MIFQLKHFHQKEKLHLKEQQNKKLLLIEHL